MLGFVFLAAGVLYAARVARTRVQLTAGVGLAALGGILMAVEYAYHAHHRRH